MYSLIDWVDDERKGSLKYICDSYGWVIPFISGEKSGEHIKYVEFILNTLIFRCLVYIQVTILSRLLDIHIL